MLQRLGGKARAGTPAQAAAFADFIVLTTPWNGAETAIRSMGDLKGKIFLDATNPLAMGPDGLGLEIGHDISAGGKVQAWATGASVFKTIRNDKVPPTRGESYPPTSPLKEFSAQPVC